MLFSFVLKDGVRIGELELCFFMFWSFAMFFWVFYGFDVWKSHMQRSSCSDKETGEGQEMQATMKILHLQGGVLTLSELLIFNYKQLKRIWQEISKFQCGIASRGDIVATQVTILINNKIRAAVGSMV